MNTLPSANKKAFTLVEIMVVVGMITVLFAAFLTLVDPVGQIKKARDSTRKSDLSLIRTGLELYYADYNGYPSYIGSGSQASDTGIECLEEALVNLDALCDGSTGSDAYVKIMPSDPQSSDGASYCYKTLNNNQDYVLCARFEHLGDDIPVGVTSCAPTGAKAGSGDYCITNPF